MGNRHRRRRQHPNPKKKNAKPSTEAKWYESQYTEIVLMLLLGALSAAWTMLGLPYPPLFGGILMAVCAVLVCHVVMFRTGWRHNLRVTVSAFVVLLFAGLVIYAVLLEKKPDVTLQLSSTGYRALSAVAHSENGLMAEKLKYRFELFNTTAFLQGRPEEMQFSLYEQDKGEWVKGGEDLKIGPIFLRSDFVENQRNGDRIIGTATISCPNCIRSHGYWIYLDVGKGGWFAETADGSEPKVIGENKTTKQKKDFFIDPEAYLNTKRLLSKKPMTNY